MAGKSGRTLISKPQNQWKQILISWEAMLVLVFLFVNIYCMNISDNYNLTNVLRESPRYVAGIFLVFPMAYILIMADIDISVGSIVCLAATMGCFVTNAGANFGLVILTVLAVGTVCGWLNGLILTKFPELPPMIVTLATQIIFRGIAEISLGSGGSMSLTNIDGFRALAQKAGIVPYTIIVAVVFGIIFGVVLMKTTFGRSLYAIGSNTKAATFAGVPVQLYRHIVFTITGFMAGVSALFLTAVLYGANTTTGSGFELDAIAMCVFGGISTAGGKGGIIGAVISACTIVCLRIGFGQINLNPQLILIILGSLLVVAALIPQISDTFKKREKKKTAKAK
ncbi:MAG: ABC transporter permease [Eubacteriales bacterium]